MGGEFMISIISRLVFTSNHRNPNPLVFDEDRTMHYVMILVLFSSE